ncbi:MAG: cellulase family glycosylhydrolase [Acutalibacteraceae bacterium]|nr:cellulase family glycosylhydrolase [Acutalibacteraceae bacterium]
MLIQKEIPRYKGFNIIDLFISETSVWFDKTRHGFIKEVDFKRLSEWGFNYVRVPVSYRIWSTAQDPYTIDENKLAELDKAVEYAEKYNLHINLGFHRIPGYCINDDEPVKEPYNLWESEEALKAAVFQWQFIAERYKHIDSQRLSFNILNEPKWDLAEWKVVKVTAALVNAIREISPDRTLHIDGIHSGSFPCTSYMRADVENCVYTCRGYQPASLTHYKVEGMPESDTPPLWPNEIQMLHNTKNIWNKAKIDQYFDLWAALSNVYKRGVICGEWGCYNKTPHGTFLSWAEDMLTSMKERNIGFSYWCMRGHFGIINSERSDVEYEVLENGDKLDRKLLELLQKY